MATGDVDKLRDLLRECIADCRDPELREKLEAALSLTFRDRWKPRKASPTRKSADKLTDAQRAEIRRLATHTGMSNRDIGRRFGVDGGRVSEVLGSKSGLGADDD